MKLPLGNDFRNGVLYGLVWSAAIGAGTYVSVALSLRLAVLGCIFGYWLDRSKS